MDQRLGLEWVQKCEFRQLPLVFSTSSAPPQTSLSLEVTQRRSLFSVNSEFLVRPLTHMSTLQESRQERFRLASRSVAGPSTFKLMDADFTEEMMAYDGNVGGLFRAAIMESGSVRSHFPPAVRR